MSRRGKTISQRLRLPEFCRSEVLLLSVLSLVFAMPSPAGAVIELESKTVDNLSQELGFPIYSWSESQKPQAVVLAIHGATLHGRSYEELARRLSRRNFAVFSPDLRGFGAWYHNSDDSNELAKHVLYKQSEDDLRKLLKKLREIYPGKPVYLMGESVGANMAVRLIASDPACADGMILSSPAIRQRLFFGPTVVKQALTVFFLNPAAQLDVTPFLKTRVSEDEKITEERVNDPLARNRMNVGELFKTRWFNKDSLKLIGQVPAKTPVLILEGSEDKLFHASDVQKLMSQLQSEDKTLKVLEGRGHINLETQYLQENVESLVADWLTEKSVKYAEKPADKTSVSSLEKKSAP